MNITAADIIDSLRVNARVVVELVRAAPAPLLKRRPRPGAWSIHEHACHLSIVQPIMLRRVEYILSTEAPEIQGYQPGRDDEPDGLLKMELDTCLSRYQSEREVILRRLAGLSEDEWRKPAVHEEYTEYSIGILARHLALHDYLHTYRMEQILLERTP